MRSRNKKKSVPILPASTPYVSTLKPNAIDYLSLAGKTRSQRRARRPLRRRHLVERPLAGGHPRVRTAGIQTPAQKHAQPLAAIFIVVRAEVRLHIAFPFTIAYVGRCCGARLENVPGRRLALDLRQTSRCLTLGIAGRQAFSIRVSSERAKQSA